MYPQNTVSEFEQDPFNDPPHALRAAYPPGSRPAPRSFQRRLGPDGEDVDDLIGPDGYTEQLPPYTRYVNDVPPKRDPDEASSVIVPASNQRPTVPQPERSDETLHQRSPPGDIRIPITPTTAQLPSHHPITDDSTRVNSTTAVDVLPKSEGGNFTQRVQDRGKKRVCWGNMPCWLLALIVLIVFLAVLIGGVVGGLLAHKHGVNKGLSVTQAFVPTTPVATTATVTTTSPAQTPEDAVLLAPTPANLPPIPTGSFAVILSNPSATTNSCLADASQNNAWDCSTGARLNIVVDLPAQGENQAPVIALSYSPSPTPVIQFGAQPPQLGGYTQLLLMKDKSAFHKGPAYAFQQQFNKTVIVREGDLPGGIPNSKRDLSTSLRRWLGSAAGSADSENLFKRQSDWTQQEFAQPGDRPWYCFWNGTLLTGFVYVTQDMNGNGGAAATSSGSAAAAATSGLSNRQDASITPQYPKQMKIEERTNSVNPVQPYCQQFQVLYNYQLNPVSRPNGTLNIVNLAEFEPSDQNQKQIQQINQGNSGAGGPGQAPQNQKRGQLRNPRGYQANLAQNSSTSNPLLFYETTRSEKELAGMPCFKGLAVSIHTPDGPLPEYSIQKQSRFSRISSYIPVPPPRIPQNTSLDDRPEQSTFAISITLLTPGLNVPYSAPKPTPENPCPQPRKVGGLPSSFGEKGRYASAIGPYIPLTSSPNETIAAYIYFDGRPKEEVATLLRRGEETWVNSRWVSVPESEGGGLAEREFLFREVGLERWLNGLDLDGKDAAAKIEKRRQKVEGKRRRRRKSKIEGSDNEEGESSISRRNHPTEKGVLRYGDDAHSPLEQMSDSDDMFLSGSEDSDDDPIPESTGQIKVALYRVLASGEIRRGEYSPQFDAHEGDEDVDRMDGDGGTCNNVKEGGTEEVDHTTSFAKPKTLDPKSISTQTVTGIDPQDSPFAVFTFLYRGEKQLQKMGILPTAPKGRPKTPTMNGKLRSIQDDFSKFKPLDANGLKNFSTMRDPDEMNGEDKKDNAGKKRQSETDSDDDLDTRDDVVIKAEEAESKDGDATFTPEDARRQGELAEGLQKIRLKRQHSADLPSGPSPAPATRKTPPEANTPIKGSTSPAGMAPNAAAASPPASTGPLLPSVAFNNPTSSSTTPMVEIVGSPLKKARSSLSGVDDEGMRKRFGLGLSGVKADVLGAIEHDRMAGATSADSGSNNAGPMARDGFGLCVELHDELVGAEARDRQAKQEQPKEVKLEDMEEEEL
ncbi:MAG: hypothetical protein Q9217_002932 [Psora testacea]